MSKPLSVIPTERNEEWWQQRHQQKLEEKKEFETKLDILFLGDSITHAWELEGEAAWQTHFAKYSAFNLGYAGDRTEHLLWRIQNDEISHLSPQYVVLLIGTNNAGHRLDQPEHIAAGIQTILTELKSSLPSCKIILMAIFPRSRNTQKPMRIRIDQTNQIIRRYADGQSVLWLDINKQLLDQAGVLQESVMPDLLHPNAKQYYKWAKAITQMIQDN